MVEYSLVAKKRSGFDERTRKKKIEILESARQLVLKKGNDGATIAEIAAVAGVSQVSIYNYFNSKEGLLEALIRGHLDASLERASAILDLQISFKEKVERFFALGNEVDEETDAELLAAIDWANPRIQRIYRRFVEERQVPFLIRFIEEGKEGGAIKADLPTEAILAYFYANMEIYRDEELLKRGTRYIAALSHLFFYGLLGT